MHPSSYGLRLKTCGDRPRYADADLATVPSWVPSESPTRRRPTRGTGRRATLTRPAGDERWSRDRDAAGPTRRPQWRGQR